MKIIEDIKDYIGRIFLNREIAQQHKAHQLVPFNTMRHIGIVYDAENKNDEAVVLNYANHLRAEGRKVWTLGFVNKKNLPHNKKISLQSEYFWKEKLNGMNLPIKGKVGAFLLEEFDLLLNLYFEPIVPMQAIAAYSSAKFRVGSNMKNGTAFYDTMIDVGQNKDLRFLIEQIDFYLKVIK